MPPQLAVSRALHQRQEEGLGRIGQPGGAAAGGAAVDLVLEVAQGRPDDLVEHGQGEWVAAARIDRRQEHLVEVVADGAKDQPRRWPPHVRVTDHGLGQRLTVVPIETRIARTGRIGVHAFGLQRDPAGAEIAFLEHVDPQSPALGRGDRRQVDLDAVVEHHQIGDLAIDQEPVDPGRPGLLPVAIGRVCAEIAPVGQVAAVEYDLADLRPGVAELIGDLAEETAERAAQEQEMAFASRSADRLLPAIGAPATRKAIALRSSLA